MHITYIVTELKNPNKKKIWRSVGAGCLDKNGTGFDDPRPAQRLWPSSAPSCVRRPEPARGPLKHKQIWRRRLRFFL
jgi:hypothetical protein